MNKETQSSAVRPWRRSSPRWLLLPCLISSFALGAASVPQDGDLVEDARAMLEKWVETRRVISQERRDWEIGREILDDRIDLVSREIESFQGKIQEARTSTGDTSTKLEELVAERDRLTQVSGSLAEKVVHLEERTKELIARLPDPIAERIRPLSQSLPEDPSDTELSLSQRFQNLVGILNAVNKFNREITATNEERTLEDGRSAYVATLYVGIGQGYYASADGMSAGTGTAGPDGWTWRSANQYAADINRAIAILKNEEPAGFVRLPLRVE